MTWREILAFMGFALLTTGVLSASAAGLCGLDPSCNTKGTGPLMLLFPVIITAALGTVASILKLVSDRCDRD
jgi:hypothetical protein